MVYKRIPLRMTCIFACLLTILALTVITPDLKEPVYAAAKAKVKVADLRVSDRISQKKLSKKDKTEGYRLVKVRWDAKGKQTATRYDIYVSKTRLGKYDKVKSVKGTSATLKLKKGKMQYIKVRGYHNDLPGKTSKVVSLKPGSGNAKAVIFTQAQPVLVEQDQFQFAAFANGSVKNSVDWSSSNKKVMSIDFKGTATALKPGSVTLTAKAHNGVKSSYDVTIIRRYPTKVTISNGKKLELNKGDTFQLSAFTDEAYDKTIIWSSSDKKVVKVDSNGVIKAKAPGVVKIKAKARTKLGVKAAKDKITITVVGPLEGMVQWAEETAENDKYGYSMSVSRKKKSLNRYCPHCVKNGSYDYDCASFVAAALVHGYGGKEVRGLCNNVGGCRSLYNYLLSNGWKNKGKLSLNKLKRGDILINPGAHVEIFTGKKDRYGNYLNVAAHDDRNGITGDASGTEVSIAPSRYFSYYTAVLRKN